MDQGANALLFRPGVAGSRMERIPFSSPDDSKRELTLKLELDPSGTAKGILRGRMSGLAAADFRSGYRNTRVRSAWLDRFANSLLPNVARVGKETLAGLDDPQKEVEINMNIGASGVLRRAGEQVLLKLSDLTGDLREWTEESARQEPLRLGPRRENSIHREFILPKDMAVERLPDPIHIENDFFSFDLSAKRDGDRSIAVDSRYRRKVAEITPAQFTDFRKAAIEVQHAADVDAIVRPGSKMKLGAL
jgi:hypothetical protein